MINLDDNFEVDTGISINDDDNHVVALGIFEEKLELMDKQVLLAKLSELVYPLHTIPSDRVIIIHEGHQSLIHDGLTISGEFRIFGSLVVK